MISRIKKETLFRLGRPIGPLYAQAMKIRAWFYRTRLLKCHRLDVPVISVGNLTMGGTGKTPLVIYLARLLRENGYRPAVISRGYRGAARNDVNIVSDGRTRLLAPAQSGDEPYLIACTLPDVIVATGKKRVFPCRKVITDHGCDAIILDDGFQHLSLARSVDLVLFDVEHFAGNSRVFPGGDLREPVSALRRCSAFLLTGVTESNKDRASKCSDLLMSKFPGKPVFMAGRSYSHALKYVPSDSGYDVESIPVSAIPAGLFCFCGIAYPERFQASLAEQGIGCSFFKSFPDHHQYTEQDVTLLYERADAAGVQGLLTTQKDMTKLQAIRPGRLPLFTPVLDIPRNSQFNAFILNHIMHDEIGPLPQTS